MENEERTTEIINELIKLNNDRTAGFEKAGADLEDKDNELRVVFTKLGNESRQYAAELADIAIQYGGEPAEGTSTLGDLHRGWIDVKSVFTASDLTGILNECERGEDAIKDAYQSVVDDPQTELSAEVSQVLKIQLQGITEGHDLIKSLRNQVQDTDEAGDESTPFNEADGAYNESPATEPSFEGTGEGYAAIAADAPESGSIAEEDLWQGEQESVTGNSKLMEFFVNELKDLLWAEKELVETLPVLAEAATSADLKIAFNDHLIETEGHITRLEQIFAILGLEPETTTCEAMKGIVREGDEIISDTEAGTAQRDVGLIFAGQKAEHYEIASYGGMFSLAKTLGYYEVAELLALTLDEEKSADELLSEIAESRVNYDAGSEPAD